MAQNLSLEALIKQAQKRNHSSKKSNSFYILDDATSIKTTIQATFMNKISNFEGDNDCVDEELESSNEKLKSNDLSEVDEVDNEEVLDF